MTHRASPLSALAFTTLLWSSAALAQGLAPVDKNFLQQAAENGHAEVSAGRLALTKARNPKVRDFAQRMVDEHTKVGEELRKGKEMIIAGLGDETFDRRYLNQMGVEAYKSAIPLYEKTALESRDPEVKAFASKHLPALREQLQAAQALKVSVDQRPTPAK
jgi:putative membrane protein